MRFFRYVGSLSGSALGRRTVEVMGRNWISSHSHINVVPGSAGVKRIGTSESMSFRIDTALSSWIRIGAETL